MTHILLVDDDDDLRDSMAEVLTARHYLVSHANSGRAALEAVRAVTFDIILLDALMPGMNGWSFLSARLADQVAINTPVVMMSAMTDIAEAAKTAGVVGVCKPVRIDVLLRVIETALGLSVIGPRGRR